MLLSRAPFVGFRPLAAVVAALRPQDVFGSFPFTGTTAAKTVPTNVDLTGGGSLLIKLRDSGSGGNDPTFFSQQRGTKVTLTDSTSAEQDYTTNAATLSATGFTLPAGAGLNQNNIRGVAWPFKKAAKFYTEVVTNGDGVDGRQIAHDLGIKPGFMATHRLDTAAVWPTLNRDSINNTTRNMALNQTGGDAASAAISNGFIGDFSASTFTVNKFGSDITAVNASGGTYLHRLWAHDPDTTNGIIQCVSLTLDANGNGSYTFPWTIQWVLEKFASTTGGWFISDTARGSTKLLRPDASDAEGTYTSRTLNGATYTITTNNTAVANVTVVLVAIRSPV